MERTIKFKAKRLDNNQWAKGSLVKSPLGTQIVWWEDSIEYAPYVDPSTVCQFTGLVDMNGKEIWEHDFIGDSYSNSFEVIWLKGAFVYRFESGIVCLACASTKDGVLEYAVNYGSKFDRKEGKQ